MLVLRRDLAHIHAALPSWTILAWHWEDEPPGFRPFAPGDSLPEGIRDIWCRPPRSETWRFQLMVMPTEGEPWFFPRDSRITGDLAQLSDVRDGIPIIAPELQLLYKSRGPHRDKDAADLRRMIPRLSAARQAWLRERVALLYPDSPALELLGS